MSEVGTKWANATPEQEQAYAEDVQKSVGANEMAPAIIDPNMQFQIEYSARATAMQYADKYSETVEDLLDNANKFYEFLLDSSKNS